MSALGPVPSLRLEALSREEVVLGNALRAQLRSHASEGDVARAASSLLGEPVSLALCAASPAARAPLAPDAVAVALVPHGRELRAEPLVVELEGALATALAARVIDRPQPTWVAPLAPPPDALAGVCAAVVAAVARRVGALGASATPLRIAGAGAAGSVLAAAGLGDGARACADATVTFRGATYAARISTGAARWAPRATALTRKELARLGRAPLALDVVACTASLARSELRRWSAGDAVLFGGPLFASGAPARGTVALAARSSDVAAAATLREDGSLVLDGELAAAPVDEPPRDAKTPEGRTMESSAHDTDPLSRALGDAPVVVRVEIGAVEMSALEWSRLGRGDVVTLQRRPADPVTLRVGGVEVARGELVEVDGELAVRLLTVSP